MSEFPEGAETPPTLTRRELLGCSAPTPRSPAPPAAAAASRELIVPYVRQPPEVTPGVPSLYATTMALDGYGIGLVVESHEGRPTKAEGNPLHPASLGALGTFEQASVLSLYDPARARELTRDGMPSTWRALLDELARAASSAGKQIHVLLEPTSSPHLVAARRSGSRSQGRRRALRRAALAQRTAWRRGRARVRAASSSRAGTSRGPTSSSRSTPTSSRRRGTPHGVGARVGAIAGG